MIGFIGSIGVAGIFNVQLTPQAFADSVSAALQNIQSLLTNGTSGLNAIQTSVNTLQSTANAIKAKTDNFAPVDSKKALVINETKAFDGAGVAFFELLHNHGTVYTGHIIVDVTDEETSAAVRVNCFNAIGSEGLPITQSGVLFKTDTDFTCQDLSITAIGTPFINAGPAIIGAIAYENITNPSILK